MVGNAHYIAIPVGIIPPNSQSLFTPGVSAYPFDTIKLYGTFSSKIVQGIPANMPSDNPFFVLNTTTNTTTLMGLGGDMAFHNRMSPTYANGATSTFISTVTNTEYSPGADYLMAMAVPTNQYNLNNTSDNNLEGYIRKITLYDAATEVYYQTASNATAADIAQVGAVTAPGGTNLSDYFTSVVTTSWVKYSPGAQLPGDVVMLVAYHPNLLQDERIRVDYDVQMMVDPLDKDVYTNLSQMKYYSAGANLEVASNVARIQNIPFGTDFDLEKASAAKVKYAVKGETIPYTLRAVVPKTANLFDSMQIIDQLPNGLVMDESTLSVVAIQVGSTPDVGYTYTYTGNKLAMDITDFKDYAEQTLEVRFTAVVDDPSALPEDNTVRNTFDLQFNNNPDYGDTSNEVDIPLIPLPEVVPVKAAMQESVPKEVGIVINYQVSVDIPDDVNHSATSTIMLTDQIADGLTVTNTALKMYSKGGGELPLDVYEQAGYLTVTNHSSGNTVQYEISFTLPSIYVDLGIDFGFGKMEMLIDTEISDVSRLGRVVSNVATMEVSRRDDPIPSNEVDVALTGDEEGTVTVRFINKTTNLPLADDVILVGMHGQAYDTLPVKNGHSFQGFKFLEVSGDAEQGTFDQDLPKVIIYYYGPEKEPQTRVLGTLTIRFLEKTTGQPLANAVTLTAEAGQAYDTRTTLKNMSFPGYRFVGTSGDAEQGIFVADAPKEVVYYYEKIEVPQGMGAVVVRFVDQVTGLALTEETVLIGTEGETYDTVPVKDAQSFPGYVYVEVTGDPEQGTFETDVTKEVVYYYIPANTSGTGTDTSAGGSSQNTSTTSSGIKTGDNSNLVLFVVLAGVAGALIVIAVLYKNRYSKMYRHSKASIRRKTLT